MMKTSLGYHLIKELASCTKQQAIEIQKSRNWPPAQEENDNVEISACDAVWKWW
jgi:hypothetical protein